MSFPRLFATALVCALIGLILGLWLGGHPENLPLGVRDAFVSDDRALRAELLRVIDDAYYRKVDQEKLRQGSLEGMVRSLGDDFSHYFSPDDARRLGESLRGNFDGVGMSIEEDKQGLRVIQVFEDSPAEDVGIREGDFVTRVDGESIAGESAEVSTAKIKGPAGTDVELTVVNPNKGRQRTVTAEREHIDVPVLESKIEERDGMRLGVIRLFTFSQGAHGKLGEEVRRLREKGVDGLVLDLRGNGGGLLQEAVLVASLFVEEGEIVTTRGRTEPERSYEATGAAVDTTTPMAVLVDRGSASASEIVAGALRDHGRAALVGEKTFGKGVFQEVIPISNGGALNLTIGSYFLPDGDNLGEGGIKPRLEAADRPSTKRDEALPGALDALASRIP